MSRTFRTRQARRIGAALRRCRLVAAAARLAARAGRAFDQAAQSVAEESPKQRAENTARGRW